MNRLYGTIHTYRSYELSVMTCFDNTPSLLNESQSDLFVLAPEQEPSPEATVDRHERPKRDFLTSRQIDKLLAGSRGGRYGDRDYALLLLTFRHGLRATEATKAKRDDLDLDDGTLWVARRKGGLSTSQPLAQDELDALEAYLRGRKDAQEWLFLSSQGSAMSRQNFHYLVGQAARRAGLGHVHPHVLRHSCGHALANKGADTRLVQDWLGHRDIRHTALYTRTSAERFKGLW